LYRKGITMIDNQVIGVANAIDRLLAFQFNPAGILWLK